MSVFDTHAHYDDAAFDEDRDSLLRSLPAAGVCGVLNAATNLDSAKASLAMADNYSFVYAAVGVHPSDLDTVGDATIETLATLAKHPKAVAIGEIGLDYHYDTYPRPIQQMWLIRQVELANYLHLPIILHDREAHEDTLEVLKKYRPAGVVHCFSGSVEMMQEVVKLGLYIGLGGAVTFHNARKPLEVAAAVPFDRLLLETDAPYMAPVPYRGKRCDSTMIAHTAEVIAQVRGCTVEQLVTKTEQNAREAFPKIK